MGKNRKLILINPDEPFEQLSDELTKRGFDAEIVHTPYAYLSIQNGETKLFYNRREIYTSDVEFFFRSWGVDTKDKHFTSILAEYAHLKGALLSSEIFRFNSKSSSKITQAIKFAVNNIPHPDSLIMRQRSYRKNKEEVLQKIEFPCVIKRTGSEGNVVWKVNDIETLEDRIRYSGRNLFIIQKYIPNNFDVRALVFKGEVLGAIKRISTDGFYNNVAQGGDVEEYILNKKEKELVIKATKAADLNFAGVDLLPTYEEEIFVLEVNRSPQVEGFSEIHPDFLSKMAAILSR
ncbi:MAG: hypothetical protein WDZ70_01710 [Candidatus Paceibacterota bacterium]